MLIQGPRQCGKTTLAQQVGSERDYAYFTFDDAVVLAAATADPVGFVADLPERSILDEVQRVPALFASLKQAVDRRRTAGRFLLTGSANVLLLPALSDSLAGRLGLIPLFPLAQCEIAGQASPFFHRLFGDGFRARTYQRLGAALAEIVVAGGFPAALVRAPGRRRSRWYLDYVETLVQRDVRELARISALDVIPRLLSATAANTATLINISDLGAPFHLSRPTIRDYVTLLERLFLVDELPPWHSNRVSRLVKTPKLHVSDTGIACALLGHSAASLYRDRPAFGQLLETFVLQELRRLASWHDDDLRFHHFRDRDGHEVDIVLERGADDLAGVEVKAASTVTDADFRGLRKLREAAAARRFVGVVLYDGEASVKFGDGLHAVPIRALWEP